MTRRLAIYVAALAILVVYFLIWPVWRAQFLIEIWPTEAWNAYFQDAAAAGRTLYPAAEDLIGNNYPPLSFYAIGYLGALLGDNLFVGRAVSSSRCCVSPSKSSSLSDPGGRHSSGPQSERSGTRRLRRTAPELYVGANDPQLSAKRSWARRWSGFWRATATRGRAGAFAADGLAGFWKHNIVAMPLAAVGCLLRDGRRAMRPCSPAGWPPSPASCSVPSI
jgi:hypothetical protein